MNSGKVLNLYTTVEVMMRAGHRMQCDEIECDFDGIFMDINYDNGKDTNILLVSKKSYDLIDEAELVIDKGFLMENIYVDMDINHLTKGTQIQIGETLFEVVRPCENYAYLYTFAPEVPELIKNNRGIYIEAVDHGLVKVGDTISIIEK